MCIMVSVLSYGPYRFHNDATLDYLLISGAVVSHKFYVASCYYYLLLLPAEFLASRSVVAR
ncbi:hypothetical protein HanXRQr2_Chr09g0370661 [Helianthus annuus]|uniref:Uncharacterized protein n=1 Tax=Helianthus annuus TaxID=4232 RepID=A0A9K3I3L2_HELAN|nr:hypothetical protein HanXRQr2_Chr09g0370661 [Helianthus annuus]